MQHSVIGYLPVDEPAGTGVHRFCEATREIASLADRDGYAIHAGGTEAGRHHCYKCGRLIGSKPRRSHVSNPYR